MQILKIEYHRLITCFAVAVFLFQNCVIAASSDKHCPMNGSMAAYRNCIYNNRTSESKNLNTKACNAKDCIFRLRFVRRQTEGTQGFAGMYEGGGYTFLPTEFKCGQKYLLDDWCARLKGPDDGVTIVGHCGGSGCGGYYEYVDGPLTGALLQGPFGSNQNASYFVLKIPR
jgi:hypothetical protein